MRLLHYILFLTIIPIHNAFIPSPLYEAPLQYITIPTIMEYVIENTESFLANSLVPVDTKDYIAIFVSEGVSGALGGLASKLTTLIDGNKNNRESVFANAEISGAYFGVTGAVRSLAQIAGLSPIAVNLFGLFLATLASEIIKIRSRLILPQRTRVENGPSMYDLMRFRNPSMFDLMKFRTKNELPLTGTERMPMLGKFTETELKADIIKWLLVYSFLPSSNKLVAPEEAIAIGALSGLLSQFVRESDDKTAAQISVELENSKRRPWDNRRARPDYPLTRIARSCVEGATQLLAYEASREYVYAISPYFQSLQVASAENSSPIVALFKLIQEAFASSDSILSI